MALLVLVDLVHLYIVFLFCFFFATLHEDVLSKSYDSSRRFEVGKIVEHQIVSKIAP